MEQTTLQRLRERLSQQKQSLADWLTNVPARTREINVGPAGNEAVEHHLATLDGALTKADENTLGLCDVCHEFIETSRLEMDYTASVCLEHLTGEQRTLLENELELSAKVQKALLPQSIPTIRGLEVAAFSQPAHIVGGDYFDFLRFKDGSHAIVIADVMGKGMPASMLMASLQASLRIIAPESREPSEIAARLNRIFCHNIQLTKFVTMFLARYEETNRTLTYTNAGHNPPLLSRGDTLTPLRPTGAAIGLVEQAEFTQETIALHGGDILLLYTDGVVESINGKREEFGIERLETMLRSSNGFTSHQILSSLRQDLTQFSGTTLPADDTTIIALRVQR